MEEMLHRRLGIALTAAIGLTLLLMVPVYATQPETTNTCKDLGFDKNLESSTSGPWGSVVFDNTEEELTLTVNSGFTVMLCVKAGSVQQGLGPEGSGPYAEGTYQVGHSSEKELSHYGVIWTVTDPSTTTTSVESTTSTSVEETTTSSTGSSTTTDPTTSSSVNSTSTSTGDSTTTTEPELPFTGGPDAGFLTVLAAMLLGLGYATLRGGRRIQE